MLLTGCLSVRPGLLLRADQMLCTPSMFFRPWACTNMFSGMVMSLPEHRLHASPVGHLSASCWVCTACAMCTWEDYRLASSGYKAMYLPGCDRARELKGTTRFGACSTATSLRAQSHARSRTMLVTSLTLWRYDRASALLSCPHLLQSNRRPDSLLAMQSRWSVSENHACKHMAVSCPSHICVNCCLLFCVDLFIPILCLQ